MENMSDGSSNKPQMVEFVFYGVKNIVRKQEIAGYQHFLFPQIFQKASFSRLLKHFIVKQRVSALSDNFVLFAMVREKTLEKKM